MLTTLIKPSRSRSQTTASEGDSIWNRPGAWSGFSNWFRTRSRQTITHDTALCNTTVGSCVRILAEEIASLPFRFYAGNGADRRHVSDSVVEKLLWKPNDKQTRYEFMETMIGHLALRGNAYAWIGTGRSSLMPLHPGRVEPKQRDDGSVYYEITKVGGQVEAVDQSRILHLKAFSQDGVVGLSPVGLHRETLGMDEAARDHAATYFGNAAKPNGFITSKTPLGPDAQEQLKQDFARFSRSESRYETPAFPFELDWKQVGLSNKDSQYLESRKFTRAELASIWRVPLHMLNDLDGAKYNNMELQDLALLKHTLRPYMVRVEERVTDTLVYPEVDGAGLFMEFVAEGLLRGDTKSRYESYRTGLGGPGTGAGWLSVNDVRRLENLPAIDGGDRVYLGEPVADKPDDSTPAPPEDPNAAIKAQIDAYGLAVRSGAITPQRPDEDQFRAALGLPAANDAVGQVWTEEPTRVDRVLPPVTATNEQDFDSPADDLRPNQPTMATPDPPSDEETEDEDDPAAKAIAVMIVDLAGRLITVEARNVGPRLKHVADDPEKFRAWAAAWFAKHATYVAKQAAGVLSLAGVDDATAFAVAYCARRQIVVETSIAGTHSTHPRDVESAVAILSEELQKCRNPPPN